MKNVKIILPILFVLALSAFLIWMPESVKNFVKEKTGTEETASICSPLAAEKAQEYEITIMTLQQEIEELKAQEPSVSQSEFCSGEPELREVIKEVIKEVPVEKIVVKEVVVKEECNYNTPYIKFFQVIPEAHSVAIKWETDKVTKGEVSVSGGNLSEPKVFPSAFSSALNHRATVTGLEPLTSYYYEIRAFVVKNGETLGSAEKVGGFSTGPETTE